MADTDFYEMAAKSKPKHSHFSLAKDTTGMILRNADRTI